MGTGFDAVGTDPFLRRVWVRCAFGPVSALFLERSATLPIPSRPPMPPKPLPELRRKVDELAHLHGLLDLVRCCVLEIETVPREREELKEFFSTFLPPEERFSFFE